MWNLTCLKTLCDFYMWKHKFQYVGWSTVVSIEQMHWISTVVENGFTNAQLHLRLSYWQNLDCHSAVQKTRRAHTCSGFESTASLSGWDDKCLLKRAQGDLSHASRCQKQTALVLQLFHPDCWNSTQQNPDISPSITFSFLSLCIMQLNISEDARHSEIVLRPV